MNPSPFLTCFISIQVNGARQLTADDVKSMLQELRTDIISCLRGGRADEYETEREDVQGENSATTPTNFRTWVWAHERDGGQARMHMVPKGWRLPRTHVKSFWTLWNQGNSAEQIQPYKYLKETDLSSKADLVQLSRCRKVMNEIELRGTRNEYFGAEGTENPNQNMLRFDECFKDLLLELYDGNSTAVRLGDQSISRIYNLIVINAKGKKGK